MTNVQIQEVIAFLEEENKVVSTRQEGIYTYISIIDELNDSQEEVRSYTFDTDEESEAGVIIEANRNGWRELSTIHFA